MPRSGCGAVLTPLLFVASIVLAAPALAQSPAPASEARDLLAHGNQDRHDGLEYFWLARVVSDPRIGVLPAGTPPATVTHFYALKAGASAWQEWGEGVPMRAVSLASRGSQLAALLEDGSWLMVSDDSTSTGRPPPVVGSELLAFADDGRTVWALAKLPGGAARLRAATPAPATRPSTTRSAPSAPSAPSTTATAAATTGPATTVVMPPATAPAPTPAPAAPPPPAARGPGIGPAPEVPLSLLSFGSEGWSGESDLPAEVARPGDAVSLGFVADEAYVAARTLRSRGEIRLYRWADDEAKGATDAKETKETKETKDATDVKDIRDAKGAAGGKSRRWVLAAVVPLSADARSFELLNGTPVPALWVGATAGPDLLYLVHSPASQTPGGAAAAALVASAPAAVELAGTRGAPASGRAAVYAMGLIRSLYSHEGTLTQQAYDRLKATPVGAPTAVLLQGRPGILPPPGQWKYAAVALAMLYVIGASFRRREQMRSMNLDPAP